MTRCNAYTCGHRRASSRGAPDGGVHRRPHHRQTAPAANASSTRRPARHPIRDRPPRQATPPRDGDRRPPRRASLPRLLVRVVRRSQPADREGLKPPQIAGCWRWWSVCDWKAWASFKISDSPNSFPVNRRLVGVPSKKPHRRSNHRGASAIKCWSRGDNPYACYRLSLNSRDAVLSLTRAKPK